MMKVEIRRPRRGKLRRLRPKIKRRKMHLLIILHGLKGWKTVSPPGTGWKSWPRIGRT